MPQVIGNKEKWKEAAEGLELSRELAKQVLSQLSYTPMAGQFVILPERLNFIRGGSPFSAGKSKWKFRLRVRVRG
jgi:hypothetical protein